jgi:hypothetical protein
MKHAAGNLTLAVAVAVSAAAAAQTPAVSPAPGASRIVDVESNGRTAAASRIYGLVIDSRRAPIARVALQLRNLFNGRVEQQTRSSNDGEFAFTIVEPGTYVVEMSARGMVVALSNAATLLGGESAERLVQTRGRWDPARQAVVPELSPARFLGAGAADTMTAGTMTSAANLGVRSVYGGEPVSAQ